MSLRRTMTMLLGLALLLPGPAFADEALSGALTRQMEVNRQRYGIAGQALLVAHDGQVLFRGVDGEADVERHERVAADHVFAVYSLSKLFASVLVMQLVEQGQVDLDAPVSTYVTDLPKSWQAIAVREFLDHTSGVPEYFAQRQDGAALTAMAFPEDLPAVFASLADTPLQFTTGTDTRYTQTNFLVLTALLETHYGKPYAQIADQRIVRKLQLGHTWLGPTALPKQGVVRGYIGRDGRLVPEQDIAWPDYALGHAGLYLTLDDLARFLQAVTSGELVSKATLRRLWQARTLSNGRRGGFAAGWEYGESGAYRQVGHDGGARVRVRVLFRDSLDGDVYVFAYLTNGSEKNVWSRVLVGSAMAAVAPDRFPTEALSESLVRYALQAPAASDAQAQARSIRAQGVLDDAELERAINTAGYSVRENLGVDPALRVFELNTVLFPQSSNAWDSLAETYAAKGDKDRAKALYDKAQELAARARVNQVR